MNGYGCVRVRVRVCRVWMMRVRSHRQTWRPQLSPLRKRCEWLWLCACACACVSCVDVEGEVAQADVEAAAEPTEEEV